jgi:hypothetical protein
MDSALFMPNEPNSRPSKTEHQVVTGQRVSTRCRLNRLGGRWPRVKGQKRVVSGRWSEGNGAGDA